MSTPFESQVLEANAKYASTYKHSGLECPPLKHAVLSMFFMAPISTSTSKITILPSHMHGLSS